MQVSNKTAAVSCRCIWRVLKKDNDLALNLISLKRIKLDEALANLEGVHFFFASITGITLNATEKISKQKKKGKKRKSSEVDDENVAEEEEQFDITFDPGVAYFISYTPNEFCNEDIIYKLLHENYMDCEVNKISTRRPKDFEDENYMFQFKLSREPDAVVKDHDSPAINSLIGASNDFCFAKCMAEEIQRPDEHENLFGSHLPAPEAKFVSEKLSRLYLVNSEAFGQDLEIASKKLRCDGLRHDFITFHGKASTVTVGLDLEVKFFQL